jgi:hypothetical protein
MTRGLQQGWISWLNGPGRALNLRDEAQTRDSKLEAGESGDFKEQLRLMADGPQYWYRKETLMIFAQTG